MSLLLAFFLGVTTADLIQSTFTGVSRPSATQPQIVADAGGSRYIVHTVFDITSLQNPSYIPIGRLSKVGPDDTLLWELSFRTQTLTGVALGSQAAVFVSGYDADGGFVSRYAAAGTLLWTVRIEGQPTAIATDPAGSVYVTGNPNASYVATERAFKTSRGDPKCTTRGGTPVVCSDAFVSEISAEGQRVFASFLGGTMEETATDIAVAPDGSVLVVGETTSSDFPTSPGSAQPTLGGVVSLGPLRFGDGFVVRLDPSGSRLIYGTYLGGPLADRLHAIAVDSSGNALVTGRTEVDPAVVPGGKGNVIVALLDAQGRSRQIRRIVTDVSDHGVDTAISADGRYYVSFAGGKVHELNRETLESIRIASLRTDRGAGIAAETGGRLSVVTTTDNRGTSVFAVLPGNPYYGSEYLARYDFNSESRPYVTAIVNAASYTAGRRFSGSPIALSPNEIVTVFGYALNGPVQVLLDGRPLPVLFSNEIQINVLVPDGVPFGSATIAVKTAVSTLGPWTAEIAPAVPGLFTIGNGAAAINQDGTINSPEHPAPVGSVVQLFGTGMGPLTADQRLAIHCEAYGPGGPGGGMEILYAGAAPGLAGVQQVNVRIHRDTAPSPSGRAAFIKIVIGVQPDYELTQDNVVIYIR